MGSRICPAGGLLESQEVPYKFAEFPGVKAFFSGISSFRHFLKKVWKFKKLEQYKEQMVVLF